MSPEAAFQNIRKMYHPDVFGRTFLHREPYPAQTVRMLCPHRRPITKTGRAVGKSKVLISDDAVRRAVTMPWISGYMAESTFPIPARIILIASVKEQAIELQMNIANAFDQNDWLGSLLSSASTKTNICLKDKTRIMVRPATHAARGLHAETFLTKKGVVKGDIRIYVDEAAQVRLPEFFQSIVNPMLALGGRGSAVCSFTTPWGEDGEIEDMWNASTTGTCMQPFTVNEEGYREYRFDRNLCQQCMRQFHSVRFNFSTAENPYIDRQFLLEEKRALYAKGRENIWKQEYLGIAVPTSGLFFNKKHHEMMWDDTLPQYRLREGDCEFVEILTSAGGESLAMPVDLAERYSRHGVFYMGYDANQGIESRRADFAVLALVEVVGDHAYLRLCQRFKKPPVHFMGHVYRPDELTLFMQDYGMFLFDLFHVRKCYPDQGFGQALGIEIQRKYGSDKIEYIKTSRQDVVRTLQHLRSMIECGKCTAPGIGFLMDETKYLKLDQDSLLEDQIRIKKAHDWGTAGAEVDGLYAWADAMRGTEKILHHAKAARIVQMDLREKFGNYGRVADLRRKRFELPETMRN